MQLSREIWTIFGPCANLLSSVAPMTGVRACYAVCDRVPQPTFVRPSFTPRTRQIYLDIRQCR